jgi:hypothetical protein
VEPSSGNFAAVGGGFGCGIDASTECAIAGDIVVHKLSPRPLFFASSLCCLPHPAQSNENSRMIRQSNGHIRRSLGSVAALFAVGQDLVDLRRDVDF